MRQSIKLTETQLAEARDWCVECWPDQEDEILEADQILIELHISKHFDGGILNFIYEQSSPSPRQVSQGNTEKLLDRGAE